jgi:hypothetical protein
MVPELVLVTEKLGQNDDPGAMDTVVDGTVVGTWEALGRLDGDLDRLVVGFEKGALDGRLDGDLVGLWDGRFAVGLVKVDGRLVGAAVGMVVGPTVGVFDNSTAIVGLEEGDEICSDRVFPE